MRQRLSSHFLRIFPSVFSSPRTITVTAEPTSCTFYFPCHANCELQISPVSRKYHPCHANIIANIICRLMWITLRRCYLLGCAVPTERRSSCRAESRARRGQQCAVCAEWARGPTLPTLSRHNTYSQRGPAAGPQRGGRGQLLSSAHFKHRYINLRNE